jgi:exodeoxyribonuclease V gamma subunit
MLYRYQSHHLSSLFSSWAENTESSSDKNPLSPLTVIVPNMDLSQWLKVHQAELAGISANIRFELPASYLKSLFTLRHQAEGSRLMDKQELQWMIFTLLGDVHQSAYKSSEWSTLRNWVNRGNSPSESKNLRWEIAAQIADVYDQYILFRPDWLEMWSPTKLVHSDQSDSPLLDDQNAWQPVLWDALRKRWPSVLTRAELLLELIESLRSGRDVALYKLPKVLHVYGLQTLSGAMTEAILLLSKYTDVHWYQLNNETFEGVDTSAKSNSFFHNLQRNQRDFTGLIDQIVQRNGIEITEISVFSGLSGSDKSKNISTYGAVKAKIINPASETTISTRDFDSISIHRCHSARREVEVLYDRLLHHFESGDLRPGDVAIVSPDPELYAPFIKEVFGALEPGKPSIPIRVSGQFQTELSIVANVLKTGLKLATSRFKSTEVLEWLSMGPVLGEYLDQTGLHNTLQRWVIDQKIRWGSNAEHVQELGFELDGRHTWQQGLNRLLVSWMTSEDQDIVFKNYLSGSPVLTQSEIGLLSRLISLINALEDIRQLAQKECSAAEWHDAIDQFLETVFLDKTTYKRSIATISTSLKQLIQLETDGILNESIPFDIVEDYLTNILDKKGLGRAWHPGYATFTGMVALHQIPYKLVAIIGLNDGTLPGRTAVSAFDLISTSYRAGDRVRRQADQQLFLDYLLTTEKILHLSYTGLRQSDNKPLAPSVMLTMLQDFMRQHWPGSEDYLKNLVCQHYLQPFHPSYFVANSGFPSYSIRNAKLSQNVNSVTKVKGWILPEKDPFVIDTSAKELTVNELEYFCRDATKYVLRDIHKIDLFETDVPDADDEPFDINHLELWKIRDRYINDILKGSSIDFKSVRRELDLKGIVPDAMAGDLSMVNVQEQLNAIQDEIALANLDFKSLQPVILDETLDVQGRLVRLTGNPGMVHGDQAFFFLASNSKSKHIFRLWLKHVLINLSRPIKSHLIFNDKKHQIRGFSREEAESRLRNLLWFYFMAEQTLVPVFPVSATSYLQDLKKSNSDNSEQVALSTLENMIDTSANNSDERAPDYVSELSTDWVKLAYGDTSPLLNRNSDANDLKHLRLMTINQLKENEWISDVELKTYEHFTVFAIKVMGLMDKDIEEWGGYE